LSSGKDVQQKFPLGLEFDVSQNTLAAVKGSVNDIETKYLGC